MRLVVNPETTIIPRSYKGSTGDFGSSNRGSNPCWGVLSRCSAVW